MAFSRIRSPAARSDRASPRPPRTGDTAASQARALQRTAGNRATASLLSGGLPVARAVDVVSRPSTLTVPRSLAARAIARGSLEFGHSSDPTRTVEHLGREGVERPDGRARWRGETLVLPGVDPARLDARSESAFTHGLRESLPFQRFRLIREDGGLALEGKINPWVRLYNNKIEVNPAAEDARPGADWFWVGPSEPHVRVRASATVVPQERARAYILPWWDESHIIIPMKRLRFEGTGPMLFGGGLPAIVGGDVNAGERIDEALNRELGEELRGFRVRGLNPEFSREIVPGAGAFYLGQAWVEPASPEMAGAIAAGAVHMNQPSREMRSWAIIDITRLGVSWTSPLQQIVCALADRMLALFGSDGAGPDRVQQFYTGATTKWMAECVRGQLEFLYRQALDRLANGQEIGTDPVSLAALDGYLDGLRQLLESSNPH